MTDTNARPSVDAGEEPESREPSSQASDAKTIDPSSFDLSAKNPNGGEEVTHRSPQAIMDEIAALDAESAAVLKAIRALLARGTGRE